MDNTDFIEYYQNYLTSNDPDLEYIISGHTYGRIYEIAAAIIDLERQDKYICLCTDNKAVIMAALLSALCGGPSVILPHAYSESAIKEVKASAGFNTVISDNPDKIPSGLKVFTPEELKGSGRISCSRDPDSVFLKLFTGGSTGKSRIWHKTPRNVFAESFYQVKSLKASKDDIIVSTVPPQHIYGLLFTVLMPYIASARIAGDICVYPQEILNTVNKFSASILISIPIHYRSLKGNEFSLPSLRAALSSAGSLDHGDALYFFSRTGIKVFEVFGSTETGGIAFRLNSGTEKAWKPFDKITWKTNDDRLCVRSEFISPDLFKDKDGFYITEDRIENNGDGTFNNLGRADGIVKVAGKRVDLKDIENKLKRIIGISDAVVISIPKSNGRGSDIAALVEGDLDQKSVRNMAKEMLEQYAVPRKIKVVDKIPVQGTGKYDRETIKGILLS